MHNLIFLIYKCKYCIPQNSCQLQSQAGESVFFQWGKLEKGKKNHTQNKLNHKYFNTKEHLWMEWSHINVNVLRI